MAVVSSALLPSVNSNWFHTVEKEIGRAAADINSLTLKIHLYCFRHFL